MKFKNTLFGFLIAGCLGFIHSVSAECWGKIDIAPAYLHLDVLNSGRTSQRLDMGAIRADATVGICKGYGWVLKPTVMYGSTFGQSWLFTGGIGVGHCTPISCISDSLILTPSVGVIYTHLRTKCDIQQEVPPFGLLTFPDCRERFRSVSPYLGLEALYSFTDSFRVCGSYQYSWSQTKTKINGIPGGLKSYRSHSEGPSYGALIEYDLLKCLSINLGVGYNYGLTKEKHGLRGMGVKVGLAYWY